MSWTDEILHIIKFKKNRYDVDFIALENAIL